MARWAFDPSPTTPIVVQEPNRMSSSRCSAGTVGCLALEYCIESWPGPLTSLSQAPISPTPPAEYTFVMSHRKRNLNNNSRHHGRRSDRMSDLPSDGHDNGGWIEGSAEPAISTDGTDRTNFISAFNALHIYTSEDQYSGFATGYIAPSTQHEQPALNLPYPIYPGDNDLPHFDIPPETRDRNRQRNAKSLETRISVGCPDALSYKTTYESDAAFASYGCVQEANGDAHERQRSSHHRSALAPPRRRSTIVAAREEQVRHTDMSTYHCSSDSTYSVPYMYPTVISELDRDLIDYSEVNLGSEENFLMDNQDVEGLEGKDWVIVDKHGVSEVPRRRLWWR
ncbi:hypothetical protein QBC44DRAFT_120195 [Cladorrhinum sp. PSN332]|nr:hypothetical protein QBC44DRAFT_120195 [Cladorrhinum sp. PSN332]